ncbi:hypothetical protein HanRHA438_Chr11g0529641 [Helianthus annuus]|nr:hypothetical protein HanRHA438_Chr11g0529641 [Helianthus annuus]
MWIVATEIDDCCCRVLPYPSWLQHRLHLTYHPGCPAKIRAGSNPKPDYDVRKIIHTEISIIAISNHNFHDIYI